MSEKKTLSPKKSLPEIVEKMTLDNIEALAIDLLESRKGGKVLFDVSLVKSTMGIEDDTIKKLSQKHNIGETDVSNTLSALTYLFRQMLTNEKEKLIEKLKKDEKIGDKASGLVEIGKKLDKRFPDVRQRFYVTTYCKTSYFADIDWEIDFKAVEPSVYHFEKRERFPVCLLRFILERPVSMVRPFAPTTHRSESVFEVPASDLDRIIATLSDIRDKMIEVGKEIATEEQK